MTVGAGEIIAMVFLAVVSLLLLFVIARKWNLTFVRINRTTRTATTPAATPTPATIVPWYKRPIIAAAAAIAGLIVLVSLWSFIEPSAQTLSLLFGGVVIVILAILGILGKGGMAGKIALVVVVVSLILFGTRSYEVLERVQKSATQTVLEGKGPDLVTKEPRPAPQSSSETRDRDVAVMWKESGKDDSLPVGIWSETLRIPVSCSAIFYPGNGTTYIIRYRSQGQEWKQLPAKADVQGDEIQVMNLEPRTIAPVLLRCRK